MTAEARRYGALLATLDAWTADARARHPGVIPCRGGCTACCHGPFDISAADALLLRETVAALPADTRAALLGRAATAASRQLERAPDWPAPFAVAALGEERFDALCETLADDPCPCLADGLCLVYEGRPAVCRMMGLGLASTGGRVMENGCPIQEEFPAYAALPAQQFDLDAFEQREEACLGEAGLALFQSATQAGYETTIALALLTNPA